VSSSGSGWCPVLDGDLVSVRDADVGVASVPRGHHGVVPGGVGHDAGPESADHEERAENPASESRASPLFRTTTAERVERADDE
jgi:hypothetical protein